MKKREILAMSILMTMGIFMFSSCGETEGDNTQGITTADIESAEDDLLAEDIYNSVDSEVDDEVIGLEASGYQESSLKSSGDYSLYDCKVVTVDHPDSTSFPKVITMYYGDSCVSVFQGDTLVRKGTIKITISAHWFVEGAVRTVELIDFYVNDVKIEGTLTKTNVGINDNGNIQFDVTLVGGKIIYNDTLQYTREANKTVELHRAENPLDDVWYITGDCKGVNIDNENYSHEITDTLVAVRCSEYSYHWIIVSGVITTTIGEWGATLDYGVGACDSTAL